MFNFRNQEQILPSTLSALAIAILAGTFLYMIFVPVPSAAGVVKGRERSRVQLKNEIATAKARTTEAVTAAGNRIWVGNAESVMAQVLAQLTARAEHYKLKVAAFRPQRPNALGGLTELPCNVQVSGTYADAVAFLGSFDTPDTRIALRSVQVASADGASSSISASLGMSVYFSETTPSITATDLGGDHGKN